MFRSRNLSLMEFAINISMFTACISKNNYAYSRNYSSVMKVRYLLQTIAKTFHQTGDYLFLKYPLIIYDYNN